MHSTQDKEKATKPIGSQCSFSNRFKAIFTLCQYKHNREHTYVWFINQENLPSYTLFKHTLAMNKYTVRPSPRNQLHAQILNRPSVDGAVLQTPLEFINKPPPPPLLFFENCDRLRLFFLRRFLIN